MIRGGFKNSIFSRIKRDFLEENPTLFQFLGLSPMLVTTNSARNALGMCIITTSVLVLSNLLISLLNRFLPKSYRVLSYIIIISGLVNIAELITKAYFFDLYNSLGLFLPLISANALILAHAKSVASKTGPLPSIKEGIFTGLIFSATAMIIAIIREFFGAGRLFGITVLGDWYPLVTFLLLPSGALLTFGFVAALFVKIRETIKGKKTETEFTSENIEGEESI